MRKDIHVLRRSIKKTQNKNCFHRLPVIWKTLLKNYLKLLFSAFIYDVMQLSRPFSVAAISKKTFKKVKIYFWNSYWNRKLGNNLMFSFILYLLITIIAKQMGLAQSKNYFQKFLNGYMFYIFWGKWSMVFESINKSVFFWATLVQTRPKITVVSLKFPCELDIAHSQFPVGFEQGIANERTNRYKYTWIHPQM